MCCKTLFFSVAAGVVTAGALVGCGGSAGPVVQTTTLTHAVLHTQTVRARPTVRHAAPPRRPRPITPPPERKSAPPPSRPARPPSYAATYPAGYQSQQVSECK